MSTPLDDDDYEPDDYEPDEPLRAHYEDEPDPEPLPDLGPLAADYAAADWWAARTGN